MSGSFFRYDDFDLEIERKIASDRSPPSQLMSELRRVLVHHSLSAEDLAQVDRLYAGLSVHRFDDYEPNYLNHPIRVAASWADYLGRPSVDEIVFGLCHNIRESGAGALADIEEAFLTGPMRERLDALTIDRTRERDPAYLERYYDRIAAANDRLIVFKALDKLDNKLLYPLYEIDRYHFDTVTDFVCPRLAPVESGLADYLEHLTRYVGSDAAKRRYRQGKPALRLA